MHSLVKSGALLLFLFTSCNNVCIILFGLFLPKLKQVPVKIRSLEDSLNINHPIGEWKDL